MTSKIQNKTLQKVRKVITTIKEIDVNNEIQIAFGNIHCDYQGFEEEIKEINRKLENLCKGKRINSLIIMILMVHALIEANYA